MAQEESSIIGEASPTDRILAEILRRLEEAQEPITISAAKLAATMGIPVPAFRVHLRGFFDDGRLVKLSSGLAGTRIAAPAMAAPAPNDSAPTDSEAPETADAGEPCEDDQFAIDAPASDAPETPQALRANIHAHLKDVIAAAGGEVTVTMASLAAAVGASVPAATKHFRALADVGHISTTRLGRSGTAVRLGSGSSAPKKAAPSPKAQPRTAAGFCPWCGSKISHPGWRFCQSCGEKLAR